MAKEKYAPTHHITKNNPDYDMYGYHNETGKDYAGYTEDDYLEDRINYSSCEKEELYEIVYEQYFFSWRR